MKIFLIIMGSIAVLYLLIIGAFYMAGYRKVTRALLGFIPDSLTFIGRMFRDNRVPNRAKLLLGALIGYAVLPLDFLPDVVPIIGQVDDLVVISALLKLIFSDTGEALVSELWPGPKASLDFLLRFGGQRRLSAK